MQSSVFPLAVHRSRWVWSAIALLTFSLPLAGCDSGSPTTPSGQSGGSSSASTPVLSAVRFTAFGDSITSGEVTVPVTAAPRLLTKEVIVPSATYPAVLLQEMQARYPLQSRDLFVFNDGKGAEHAEDALPRFVEDLNLEQPSAVLLMEGYNDICCGNGTAGVRAGEHGITQMAEEARLRGVRVFIATLAPPLAGGVKANNPDLVASFNDGMREIASSEGAILVDVYGALLPDVGHNIGVDGLHPTELGYHRIADTFFAAIQRQLEQK